MKKHSLQKGLTLVELMIAVAIGSILLLGLIQVFVASRNTYQMSEAMGRVQENGRFALDYLQRDIRMAGHMGCINDQARLSKVGNKAFEYNSTFVTLADRVNKNFDVADRPQLNYHNPVLGFEAENTVSGDAITIANVPGGDWAGVPALGIYADELNPAPVPGSDIVSLRFFSPDGIPITSYTDTPGTNEVKIVVETDRWNNVIKSAGYGDNVALLGIADCWGAVTFQATNIESAGGNTTITVKAENLNKSGLNGIGFTVGQMMLYRAESMLYYVGYNDETRRYSLYRARYASAPGANDITLAGNAPEELVDGIENLQFIYGIDYETDPLKYPSGYISTQRVADATTPWNRVGLMQVAMLTSSPENSPEQTAELPTALGVSITPPDNDKRLRTIYDSTIAMRNRLYGN